MSEDDLGECPECGEELSSDCWGAPRCHGCRPCPGCDDGGWVAAWDDSDEQDEPSPEEA